MGLWRKLALLLVVLPLLASVWPAAGLTPTGHYEARLGALTSAESFSLSLWTVRVIGGKVWQAIGDPPGRELSADEQKRIFDEFFATADEANQLEGEINDLANKGVTSADGGMAGLEQKLKALRQTREQQVALVEHTIEDQVEAILKHDDISLFQTGSVFLPPVFSKLVDLPHVLVVSYRDHIEMRTQVAIRRTITVQQTGVLEDTVDRDLNVSSLVVPIGGYSTYPTMIAGSAPLDFVLGAVTHEWCHIFLMFRPLGESYGKSSDVAAMNETACSIFGDDAAALVRETYYGAEKTPRPWQTPPTPAPVPGEPPKREEPQGFNANRELRKIYLAAEERLKVKDITGAEEVMEEGRRRLADNGFYLRKLNQAFFAFYGSYAEGPDSIRPDPIGDDLRALRRRSPTLRDFMLTLSKMTSYNDLKRALGK